MLQWLRRSLSALLAIVLLSTAILVASFVPEPRNARSAPAEKRIEVCHRTSAKNNPYRRIRVAWGAVQGGGHGGHNGAEFDIANPAGNTSWGDIFYGSQGGGAVRDKNWDTGGKAIYGIDSSGLRITPATYSYNGATRTACKGMTASEYITSETTAAGSGGGGKSFSQVITDLDDQGADEDLATLRNLGYSTFAAWNTANSSKTDSEKLTLLQSAESSAPTVTTNAATSVGRTTATVSGSVSQNSFSNVLTVYFEYGTDPGLAVSTLTSTVGSTTASSSSTFSYSTGLTGLTASTTYYFRIYAENSDGSVLLSGSTLSFTTSNKLSRTLTLAESAGAFASSYAFNVGTKPTAKATASNDDADPKSYSSSTTTICTVDSSTGAISFVDAGTCTLGASIAEGTTYAAATAIDKSFTITAATRTLSLAEAGGAFSASYAFDVGTKPTALATPSAGTGAITYSSSTASVCTVNSSTGAITFVDAGACTLSSSIAANLGYATATSLAATFTVNAVSRTISIDASSYNASYSQDETPPTLSSTVVGGGAGSKTYSSSTTSVCTVNSTSGLVALASTGTCTINVSIAANLGYGAASSSPISFSVTAATLTPRELTLSTPSSSYGFLATPPSFTATESAGAGNGTKSFSSLTTSVCTINGSGAVTFVDSGSCEISASITSGGGFAAATANSRTFTITATTRTLTLATTGGAFSASYAFDIGTKPTALSTPSAGSGTKTYSSSTTSICTVNSTSGAISFVDSGTCSITGSIAANLGYATANSSASTFTIDPVARTISIDSGSYSASYAQNATPPTLTSTVVGGGAGAKTYTSSTTSVCTVNSSSGLVAFVTTGTCSITVSIAANLGYASATSSAISFTVTSSGGGGGGGGTTTTTAAPATTTTVASTTTTTVAAATTTTTTTSSTSTTTTLAPRRITICHATGSRTNPYVAITVDLNGLNGHGDHPGDIIPAPAAGCSRAAIAAATSTTSTTSTTLAPTTTVGRGRPGATTTTVAPTTSVPERQKITICHATKSSTNPYVEITVDLDGLNGHGDHGDDIIPAPAGGCDARALKDAVKEAETTAKKVQAKERITICHATGSESNPFVEITIDTDGLAGHADHEDDIIPAPAGGCGGLAVKKAAEIKQQKNNGRITICHATSSATNPFVEITVDMDGLNGHGDHQNDIIPAPAGGCPKQITPDVKEKMVRSTDRIKICHATGSATNPYVEITIDTDGLAGHGDHPDDIIPAPAEGCGKQSIAKEIENRRKPNGKITICHATRSATNPYVEITIDIDGLSGHGDHLDDIIPAPLGGCGQKQIDDRLEELGIKKPETIDICHATKDPNRPYVKETVDYEALDGHGEHNGDIVPAPAAGCSCGAIDAALQGKSAPPGSLTATLSEVNAERNGGAATDLYELVEPKAKKSGTRGGSVTLAPESGAPSMQLLSATVDGGGATATVTSSGVDYNKPATWQAEGFGDYCWKLEPFGDNDYRYLLPAPSAPPDGRFAGRPYSAVIVKAGSIREADPAYQVNTTFMNPAGGTEVFADVNKNGISDPGGQGGGLLGDKAISHIILCVGEGDFEEVVVTTTTSTTVPPNEPPASTTTTTLPSRVMVNACPKNDDGGGGGGTSTTTTTVPRTSTTSTTIAGTSTSSSSSSTSTTAPGSGGTTTTTTGGGGATTTTTAGGGSGTTTTTTGGGATTTTIGGSGTTTTTAVGGSSTTSSTTSTSSTLPPSGTTTTTSTSTTSTTSTTVSVGTTTTTVGGSGTTTTTTGGGGATTTTTAGGGGTTTTTTAGGGGGTTTTTTAGGGGAGTTTTTVGGGGTTTTTIPGGETPLPLTFDIVAPPGKPLPKDATVTVVVSTGTDIETMVLTIDLVEFKPAFDYVTVEDNQVAKPVDRPLETLPTTGGPRWTREQQIGWLLATFGLVLIGATIPARRRRRRRAA